MKRKGLVYLFSGDGKGKTSAALGVALRMLLTGKMVVWISWFKSEEWTISEKSLVKKFPKTLSMYWIGKGFYLKGKKRARVNKAWIFDKETAENHKISAKDGLMLARSLLSADPFDLLILDEVVNAVWEGLVTENDLIEVVKQRGKAHVVLTGRGASDKLIEVADLVTEMKKIKHPFDRGEIAVKGLDY